MSVGVAAVTKLSRQVDGELCEGVVGIPAFVWFPCHFIGNNQNVKVDSGVLHVLL